MYQPRFRHRNVLQNDGNNVKYEQYATSTCTVSPTWSAYFTALPGTNYSSIDYMDDIAGDPPAPKQGLSGFKFHPMVKAMVSWSGNGDAAWLVRNKAQACGGTANAHYTQFRRGGTQNASRHMSGISTVPMYGDRLDFSVPTLGFPYEELERLQGLVSTAVLAKRGKYGESNLYESLAEMDKTFGMLKDIFDRARRIQNTIFYGRKGSSRPRKLTEEVAGQYLATRYGFAPLIKDLEGIIAGLEKRLGQRLMTTRATERWSSVTNTTLPPHTDAGTIDFLRSSRVEQNLTVQAFSLDNVKLDVWGALGLGWKDLLSVPWELKSHSFVVDWFLNVGDLFGALLPDIGFSNVGQGLVINWTRVDTTTYTGAVLNPGKVSSMDLLSSQTPPPQTRTITYKQRTVLPLKASLRWKSDFRFDKLTRMLDSVALFTQQASKLRDSGQMSELDDLIKHRRRSPSRKGVRKAADYQNLSDR